MQRLFLFVAITSTLCLSLPSEARSQSRGMRMKMRESQKREQKKQKAEEARQKAEQERRDAEKKRYWEEMAAKVYDLNLEGTITLKDPEFYEVHGTIIRLTGSGDVDMEVTVDGEKRQLHFDGGSVVAVHRLYETETDRLPRIDYKKFLGKVVYSLYYNKEMKQFMGQRTTFQRGLILDKAVNKVRGEQDIGSVTTFWREYGNEDHIGFKYTWSETWAKDRVAQLEASNKKGIMERAWDHYNEMAPEEREQYDTIMNNLARNAEEAGDVPEEAPRSPKASKPKEPRLQDTASGTKTGNKSSSLNVTITGKIFSKKTFRPVAEGTTVRARPTGGISGAMEDISPNKAKTAFDGSFSIKVPTELSISLRVNDKEVWYGKPKNDVDVGKILVD